MPVILCGGDCKPISWPIKGSFTQTSGIRASGVTGLAEVPNVTNSERYERYLEELLVSSTFEPGN